MRGTIAPLPYSFLQIGFDYGMISGETDVDYYSLYPFIHYAFFLPFNNNGWYIGAGGGFKHSVFQFPEGQFTENVFVVELTTGVLLWNWLDISYTARSDFNLLSNKISVGYTQRFR
jgi:hypothetical protein